MQLELESLLVGLFAILPGFVSGGVRSIFLPSESTSAATWMLTSVLRSLFLNAVALALALPWWSGLDLSKSLAEVGSQAQALTGWNLVGYTTFLFALAAAWGAVTGLWPKLSPQAVAYARRLTPISPEPDVLHLALNARFRSKENLEKKKKGDEDLKVPWLRFESEGRQIVGRMRHTSVRIERDKPFEVFLDPVYGVDRNGSALRLGESRATTGAEFVGIYTKIQPEQVLEVFSAAASWEPDPGS